MTHPNLKPGKPVFGQTIAAGGALLTDLYQLTMLQGYYLGGMNETAVFEFFVRSLPPERGFLVAAGLQQAMEYLENLRFSDEELHWLAGTGKFRREFLASLKDFRFTGDVDAMPEGAVFFPQEPILRVTAPLREAQYVESRLIMILHFQTLIASKAARCVLAAPDKLLVDFGMRRCHGAEASLYAARASYLAGFAGTSTVAAGHDYGIPIFGTMAHSFVQAHRSEEEAFDVFARAQPENAVLILDTFDTEKAAAKVVEIAPRLEDEGIKIRGVRLDSGDLAAHARAVRNVLDEGGLGDVLIFASGNLGETRLKELYDDGVPIDGFGVGTRLDTSADAPYLDCAYKLQEYAGVPKRKRSEGKATLPGKKQVFRFFGEDNTMTEDVVGLLSEEPGRAVPLLGPVMAGGKRVRQEEPLETIRERVAGELKRLPERFRRLENTPAYPVRISRELQDLAAAVDRGNG